MNIIKAAAKILAFIVGGAWTLFVIGYFATVLAVVLVTGDAPEWMRSK